MYRLVLGLMALCLTCFAQSSPQEVMQQAIAAQKAGRFATAVAGYRLLLEQYPNVFEIRSNLGAALAGEGLYVEAITAYQNALLLRNDPQVRLNLALAYYKAGDFSRASSTLERIQMEQPGDVKVITLLADCYLNLGKNDQVIALLEPVHSGHLEDEALIYLLGTALVRDGRAAEGQVVIDQILKKDSAEALLLIGTTKYMAGNFAGARDDLHRAIVLNPNLPEIFSYYGMALLFTGDKVEARRAFERELASDPNDFVSNLHMGVLLRDNKDDAGALSYLNHALQLRPDDPGVRYEIASIELTRGQLTKATRDLESLVKDSPDFMEAHWSLATIYLQSNRRSDGERERSIAGKLNQARHQKSDVAATTSQ